MPDSIMFDIELMRPGCVNIQACHGCGRGAMRFPSESWLVSITPGMRKYSVTEEQLDQLVEMVEQRMEERRNDG